MAEIRLEDIGKIYPDGTRAVGEVTLTIKDSEFLVLVGPSGCGKSTVLRMIAGLEEISEGKMYIGDKLVNDVAPKDRDIAMVFQNYALYPHMTVYDNMAFGLKLRKTPKDEIKRRVDDAAEVLEITEFLDRKPKALSGGQRQRVAMGRAIVREPKAFLMDEPLSNLDAKLRVAMRTELGRLHLRLGTTTVYVTHDQVEAMSMADQIVLLNKGIIEQQGPPEVLYEKPESIFVSSFIGAPPMNIVKAASLESGSIASMLGWAVDKYKQIDSFGIRPESINISETGIPVKVQSVDYLGGESILKVKQGTCVLIVKVKGNYPLKTQQDLNIDWSVDDIIEFDRDGKSMKAVSKERRGE